MPSAAIVETTRIVPVFTPPFVDGKLLTFDRLIMLLWGGAGIGKSQLAHRMAHHLESLVIDHGLQGAGAKPRKDRQALRSRSRRGSGGKTSRSASPFISGSAVGFLPRIIILEKSRLHSYYHVGDGKCPLVFEEPTGNARNCIEIVRSIYDEATREGKIPFVVIDTITELRLSDRATGQYGDRQKAIFTLTIDLPPGIYVLISQARQVIGPYGGSRPGVAPSNEHHFHIRYRVSHRDSYVIEISPISMLPAGPDVKIPAKWEVRAKSLEELEEMLARWVPLAGWTEIQTLHVQD